jgi:hypothetical protein
MKWGIVYNLSLVAFLFPLPIILSALLPMRHTERSIRFYDQNGDVIWFQPSSISKSYIVRTTKSLQDIYGDLDKLKPKLKDGSQFEPARLHQIRVSLYDSVVQLIRDGDIKNQLVKDNTVEIENMEVLREIIKKIPDDRRGGNMQANNREYGGMILANNSLAYFAKSPVNDPCSGGLAVIIPGDGKAEYHSHPSGTRLGIDTRFELTVKTCGFVQGPSKKDEVAVKHRLGYVFGMANGLIHVYDSSGIKAVFPFPTVKEDSSR